MRKIYLLTLLSINLFNCQNKSDLRTDLQPIYSDSKNALQNNNQYGKVKKIEEYTDFGELKKVEYFDNYGELLQTNTIDYNKNPEFIKSVSISKSNNSKILQTVQSKTRAN